MADRRPEFDDPNRKKRRKISLTDMDPETNPYLAHMYENSVENNNYSNGYGRSSQMPNGTVSALASFPRHATDAAMARRAEDGPNNPFNGKPLSSQYFDILKMRRNLPVHAQR